MIIIRHIPIRLSISRRLAAVETHTAVGHRLVLVSGTAAVVVAMNLATLAVVLQRHPVVLAVVLKRHPVDLKRLPVVAVDDRLEHSRLVWLDNARILAYQSAQQLWSTHFSPQSAALLQSLAD